MRTKLVYDEELAKFVPESTRREERAWRRNVILYSRAMLHNGKIREDECHFLTDMARFAKFVDFEMTPKQANWFAHLVNKYRAKKSIREIDRILTEADYFERRKGYRVAQQKAEEELEQQNPSDDDFE
jgi:hypothetical protein